MKKDVNYLSNLSNYVKKNLDKGYTKESLKWALINQGHSKLEIEKAFKIAEAEMMKNAVSQQSSKPKISYEAAEIAPVQPEKQSFWKKFFG